LGALGLKEDDLPRYHAASRRRHAELLNGLTNLKDERLTYDLRLISFPDTERYTRGRIDIALLCRLDDAGAAEAEAHAHHLLGLLDALFEEYEFRMMAAREIENFLHSFDGRHSVQIMRRAELARLDTLQSGERATRPLGFTPPPSPAPSERRGSGTILHVYPFLPTGGDFSTLFKMLLREPEPVAVSCRLRPTSISSMEEAFLEEQIASCERAAQVGLGSLRGDLSSLRPTLQHRARQYEEYQSRLLFGLKDNAGQMLIQMVSPSEISAQLIDTIGGLTTEPAGGMPGGSAKLGHHFLAGGYEVLECSRREQLKAFEEIDIFLPDLEFVPENSGRLHHLFDSVEALAAFRFPPAILDVPLGLEARTWRRELPSKDLPETGTQVGVCETGDFRQPIYLDHEDRRRHTYIVGQTGTGKTTLLKTMMLEDIEAGEGLCVIDPHGDLYCELLGKIPEHRVDDVVLLDPTDTEHPVGLNLLECDSAEQRHFIAQELTGIVRRLLEDEYGHAAEAYAGPMFFQHMRMNLLLAMSDPECPGTLLDFYSIFEVEGYWKRWKALGSMDPQLRLWVEQVLPKTNYSAASTDSLAVGSYFASKFHGFIFDPRLRGIFAQERSTVDLRKIMDEGKILLVNLAKGELTEESARFLGMVLMAKLMAAAMGRVEIPESDRRIFHLYVDEFQSLATQSFVTLLSEARKFGLSLVLANQFLSQIKQERIVQSIFGNVGTLICFRLGIADAEMMEREFFPVLTRFDLGRLPNWWAYMKTSLHGRLVQPFSFHTVRSDLPFDADRADQVLQASREKFGRAAGGCEETSR